MNECEPLLDGTCCSFSAYDSIYEITPDQPMGMRGLINCTVGPGRHCSPHDRVPYNTTQESTVQSALETHVARHVIGRYFSHETRDYSALETDIACHVIGCYLSQESRVQSALETVGYRSTRHRVLFKSRYEGSESAG